MKKFRFFALVLTALVAVFILFTSYIVYLAVSDEPLVVSTKNSDPQSLLALKNGVKQAIRELNSSKKQKVVSIKHHEIDELLAIVSRSFPSVSAKYNHSDLQLLLGLSIKLPSNYPGNYLNVSAEFTDNRNLSVGTTSVGDMSFNNDFVFYISFLTASLFFDSDLIALSKRLLINTSYSLKGISLSIDEDIDTRLVADRIKQNLKKYSNLAWDDNRFNGVAHYYNKLLDFSRYTRGIDRISILDYLKVLFVEAKTQSSFNSPSEENTNALLALGLYAGDYNFRTFLSHVTNIELNRLANPPKVELAERRDLMLHFLYSATIQILSSKDLSLSIGELKEINDMGSGGSGFSFADLAADRAGIQFVTLAMDKKGGASHLQSFLIKANSEESFFPDIFGLKEQLSLSEFENEYRSTNSKEYKSTVREIDRRIRLLPLYVSYRN